MFWPFFAQKYFQKRQILKVLKISSILFSLQFYLNIYIHINAEIFLRRVKKTTKKLKWIY